MDKQTTLAFVLIGLILITWLYFNSPEPPKEVKSSKDSTLVKDNKEEQPKKSSVVKTESDNLKDSLALNGPFAESQKNGRIITIETDLVKMFLNTKGGRILRYYLKDYKTWYYKDKPANDFYNTHVQLINPKNGGDLNLLFVTKDGQKVNTAKLDFSTNLTNSYYRISGKDSLPVSFFYKTEDGRILEKSFVFYANNYESDLAVKFVNMQNTISGMRYDISWDEGINFVEENSVDEANYSSASAFMGGEQEIIDAAHPGDKVQKEMNGKIDWVGVRNKYFVMILAPKKSDSEWGASFEGIHKVSPRGQKEIYSAAIKVPFKESTEQVDKFSLFLGPCDYDLLKSYDNNYQAIYDFGSFFGLKFITRPISEYILLPVFQFLHLFIPNYGFVIILFSLLIKIALYPLSKQSMASMKKMQLLQPKITEIKEKYKDDQQKIQTETMKLYQTYGINPAGGCLPMLLQMPILFALFTFFNVAIELRHEPFIWWITNLSSPDVIFTLPFKIPLFGVSSVSGLALLLGITMFLQQKQTVKDPSQAAMVYLMPIMFTLMFMNFSSGLNLYYLMFNLFSIAQQEIYNRTKGNVELVPVKPGQKKGFFARMMEAAEKQAQAQKEANKNRKK
jgi:YidC/Oxa1 family membrane protein insertase